MNKKIVALTLILALIMTFFSACGDTETTAKKGDGTQEKQERKPQLVVAMNPILAGNDGVNHLAFNDVKNAISTDRTAATLTSLSDETNWVWTYKVGENWKKRGIYGLSKWRNGDYASADKISAYSFTNDGTVSLMPYTVKAANLTTYQGEIPEQAGVLLSVAGTDEESLCYQFTEDTTFGIPEGKITAIESVGGIKTGFLAEDGTSRSAAVKFIVNTRVLWAGQFNNSTAGDGVAATELTYPDIPNIEVEAGDKFFISVQLDAQANFDEDITVANTGKKENKKNNPEKQPTEAKEEKIVYTSVVDDYESRFSLVYPSNASIEIKQALTTAKKNIVSVLEADVAVSADSDKESDYEILVGLTSRKESKAAFTELTNYRANNGSDFIVKMDGHKLVVCASTDYALKLAIDYVVANIYKTDKEKIPSNYKYVYRPNLSNIYVGNANIASYTIRTEKYPSVLAVRAAHKLSDYIISKTGYSLKIDKDTKTTDNEILIGLTTRSGISAATFKSASLDFAKGKKGNTYNSDDYSVFLDGTKLFVEAGSDYASTVATMKLIDFFKSNSKFTAASKFSGKYDKGDYSLIDDYAYTWGDEFYTSSGSLNKKNWKAMEKGYDEKDGPLYSVTDPYYLASKASLEDSNPNNDFGGPWLPSTKTGYVTEGKCRNILANASIKDNMLVQTAKKELSGYTNSVLCTEGRMEFRYGILETRIIAATSNGNDSCFWTRTKDGGAVNEMDVFENFGDDKFVPNLHTWDGDTHVDHGSMITLREKITPAKGEHFYDTFHHVALEWTPEFINFYLDGEIYLSQEITSDMWYAFKETTYVILNSDAPSGTYNNTANPGNFLAGGSVKPMDAARKFDTNGDGRIDINDFCENQYVDYIRLYQLNSRQYSLKAKK